MDDTQKTADPPPTFIHVVPRDADPLFRIESVESPGRIDDGDGPDLIILDQDAGSDARAKAGHRLATSLPAALSLANSEQVVLCDAHHHIPQAVIRAVLPNRQSS